ncbi:MAG: hypothetical protein V3R93_01210 [Candidatus Hydrothermarchaeaceae archaeon]
MNEKSMAIMGVLLVLGLVSIGTTQEPSEPRITDAYVDPLKVRPGDTIVISPSPGRKVSGVVMR